MDPLDQATTDIRAIIGLPGALTVDQRIGAVTALALVAVAKQLEQIDDALRNTIGGVPR
jgi:hypothetical protein